MKKSKRPRWVPRDHFDDSFFLSGTNVGLTGPGRVPCVILRGAISASGRVCYEGPWGHFGAVLYTLAPESFLASGRAPQGRECNVYSAKHLQPLAQLCWSWRPRSTGNRCGRRVRLNRNASKKDTSRFSFYPSFVSLLYIVSCPVWSTSAAWL